MNAEQRKMWDELVEYTRMDDAPLEFCGPMKCNNKYWDNVYDSAILAVSAHILGLEARLMENMVLLKDAGDRIHKRDCMQTVDMEWHHSVLCDRIREGL